MKLHFANHVGNEFLMVGFNAYEINVEKCMKILAPILEFICKSLTLINETEVGTS
jgi:hypothetical protein